MPDKRHRELTILILTAIALGVVDSLIPRPVPFMKLGLANVAAVIAVVRFGFIKTLELNLLRTLAVALVTGLLATPAFLLSLSGALASAAIMGLLRRLLKEKLSVAGLSMAGAVASLWGQLFVATLILTGLPLQNIVLLLTVWGIVSGGAVGILAQKALGALGKTEALRKVEG